MSDIGFIGTGTIGGPIAERLISDTEISHVFDINPDATRAHEARGARRAASAADIANACETVFLSLPGPPQIRDVVLGPDGLLAHAGALRIIVDLSTNSLALNREIAEAAHARGIHYLDAPVSGGKVAARDGTLAVMVGGDRNAFDTSLHFIERFGKHVFYLGDTGSGTLTKLINNQIFLAASVLIQEGFVMGAKAGMDAGAMIEVLKVSSAGALMRIAPLVLSRKFNQDIFALSIASKDIDVALASADTVGASMPMTRAASEVYHRAVADGFGAEDFYATAKVLEAAAGIELAPLQPRPARPD
jgi:3-hydroxyisobutyrate dehydrogenase-like beta-hydroxyacid dehydrogenase